MQADFPRFVHTAVFKSPVRVVSIGVAKGGKGAMAPPKFLENIVILWFERPFSTQNSVIRLKSNIVPPPNFGLATPLVVSYGLPNPAARNACLVLNLSQMFPFKCFSPSHNTG